MTDSRARPQRSGRTEAAGPDADRRRHVAQRIVERYHAGRLDAETYRQALAAIFHEEFAQELGSFPGADGSHPDELPPGVREAFREAEADEHDIRAFFPSHESAPGIWLVLRHDRCAFCGRELPVLGLKADGDDDGEWVKICADDLELIRSQAAPALAPDEGGGRRRERMTSRSTKRPQDGA